MYNMFNYLHDFANATESINDLYIDSLHVAVSTIYIWEWKKAMSGMKELKVQTPMEWNRR